MSLFKGSLILVIFSKNQLLDSLILTIVLLVSMLFNPPVIWVISSLYLLRVVFVVLPRVLVGVGFGCLFEVFLFFLARPVSLCILSGVPLLCHIGFGLL